jgi:hypothetical protein
LADRHVSHHGDAVFQACAAAQSDVRADHAKGADLDVVVDLGMGINQGVLRNVSRHGKAIKPAASSGKLVHRVPLE